MKMELELNSRPRSMLRCRMERIWVWDEMEVDGRAEQDEGQLQHHGRYSSTVDMDEKTWGKLPGHLLESQILVRLPLESLFRFRSVCMSWNLLIFSDEFLKRYYELVSSDPNR